MKKLYGITVALITPISRIDGCVDYDALAMLVERLITKGVHCLYCCGTDGEMYHLTTKERQKVLETVINTARGRVVVYSHCGAMLVSDTLTLVKHAESIGADGVGIVTPSYFPITEAELENYYVTIANSVSIDFPVYVYNIPQLSVNDIKPDVVQRVANQCPNLIGIKYNYADINQTFDYTRINDYHFSVLQGDDRVLPAWLALGCDGTVAGSANVFPEPLVASYNAFMDGNLEMSLAYARIAAEYVDAMQGDNVAYFKEGLRIRGLDVGTMRAPQMGLNEQDSQALQQKLVEISYKYNIPLSLFND